MKRNRPSRVLAFLLPICAVISLIGCTKTDSVSSENNSDSEDSEQWEETYAEKLFDTSYVHTINIEIEDGDWEDLLENPTDKTKYNVNITIDGETVEEVSFATKGNTSLSSVASDEDSDRYSFKVNFGKYVDGQTYYGLDKLNLNNLYADATYMKDYIAYQLFQEVGVDGPLTSYVWLTVNGEDQGLYLAIEDIGDSYLDRTEDGEGELYKPETEMLGNMDQVAAKDGDGERPEMPDDVEIPEDFDPENMPDMGNKPERPDGNDENKPDGIGGGEMPGGFGGMGQSSNGADLKYTDDEISSYSDIFDNAETDADEEDFSRVIEALKNLSEGNVEDALDTDEVIRYFVAHNFVLNYDSYTGSMLHNYYLYENDGELSMLPWDYNLSFGGFGGAGGPGESDSESGGSDATSLINTGIDSPLQTSDNDDRPMWSWIVEDETYTSQYHEIFGELISSYFESGDFEAEIDRVYEMLLPYVEKDPTAFYSADEFTEAVSTLKQFCLLRAESIRAQLGGTLSTITSDQEEDAKIDGSGISIEAMGSQGKDKEKEQKNK